MTAQGNRVRFMVVSVNETQWGGSEELWARASLKIHEAGHEVSFAKPNLDRHQAPVAALLKRGVRGHDLMYPVRFLAPLFNLLYFASRPAVFAVSIGLLWMLLRLRRPDFVILSQGGNWDGVAFGRVLARYARPYAVISQKATDLYWPPDRVRTRVQELYRHAAHSYFVSQHNRELTEQQIGARIPAASVVRNPFLTDYAAPVPWPEESEVVDFACVGRLYPMEKGQDLILRVLARDKWRQRPVRVSFYGQGIAQAALQQMADYLGLADRVRFLGHVADVPGIWREHPALLLASRAEGLPLVLVEAMLAGRVVITTDAGGSAEVVEDNVTAFLSKGATEDLLDDAMERAWMTRAEWPAIGLAAHTAIKTMVPADPAKELAESLLAVAAASLSGTRDQSKRLA